MTTHPAINLSNVMMDLMIKIGILSSFIFVSSHVIVVVCRLLTDLDRAFMKGIVTEMGECGKGCYFISLSRS